MPMTSSPIRRQPKSSTPLIFAGVGLTAPTPAEVAAVIRQRRDAYPSRSRHGYPGPGRRQSWLFGGKGCGREVAAILADRLAGAVTGPAPTWGFCTQYRRCRYRMRRSMCRRRRADRTLGPGGCRRGLPGRDHALSCRAAAEVRAASRWSISQQGTPYGRCFRQPGQS